jgi:hypothetical protein
LGDKKTKEMYMFWQRKTWLFKRNCTSTTAKSTFSLAKWEKASAVRTCINPTMHKNFVTREASGKHLHTVKEKHGMRSAITWSWWIVQSKHWKTNTGSVTWWHLKIGQSARFSCYSLI